MYLHDNGLLAVITICAFILIVLFGGDPDIHDAILANLSQECMACNLK